MFSIGFMTWGVEGVLLRAAISAAIWVRVRVRSVLVRYMGTVHGYENRTRTRTVPVPCLYRTRTRTRTVLAAPATSDFAYRPASKHANRALLLKLAKLKPVFELNSLGIKMYPESGSDFASQRTENGSVLISD